MYGNTISINGSGSDPTVTIETTESGTDSHFSWNNACVPNGTCSNGSIIWTDNNDILTPTTQVQTKTTQMKTFHFYFNDELNSQILVQKLDNSSDIYDKVVAKGGKYASNITMDFHNKGLYSAENKGNIAINFAGKGGKTVVIQNLSVLNGGLYIYGGSQTAPNTFQVSVGSLNGDIEFGSASVANFTDTSINISQQLVGNIQSSTDGVVVAPANNTNNTVNFNFTNGGTMTGDVKGFGAGHDPLKRVLTFSEASTETTVLTGNIFSYGTNVQGIDRNAGNHITFEAGNMEGSVVATRGNGQPNKKGYNNLTFKGSHTITGGILAEDINGQAGTNTNQGVATNTINIKTRATLNIQNSKTEDNVSSVTVVDKNSVRSSNDPNNDGWTPNPSNSGEKFKGEDRSFTLTAGSITARYNALNEINLEENSTLNLNNGSGTIITENNGSAQSKISFSGTGGTLRGNIITSAGTATINIADSKDGTITGNITKSGSGVNNIALGGTAPTTYIRGVQTLAPVVADTSASLTLQGEENTVSTLTTTATNSTLTIDASNNSNSTTIATITGNNLIADFKSAETHSAKLSLTTTNSGLTIKDITTTAGENNILALSGTDTATISNDISIDANKGIIFDLSSGSSITFTGGITTSGTTTFKLGGTSNTIAGTLTNNGTHNFVISQNATLKYNDGLTFSSGNNNINFIDNATLDWKDTNNQSQAIATSGSSTTTITVANEKSGVITGSITTTAGSTNVVLGSANAGLLEAPTPAPTTLTLKGTTNQITSVTANVDGAKLVLDTSINKNETTLDGVSGDNKLTVDFNGATTDSGNSAKLTLNGASNKLKAITLGADSKNNTLAVAGGSTSINDNFSVTTGQEMGFEVSGTSSLAFTNGLSNAGGVINIKGEGTAGNIKTTTLSSNITTSSGTTNLYFKDALWIPDSSATREGTTSGTVNVSGGTSNLAVELSSASGLGKTAVYDVVTTGGVSNILVKGTTDIGAQVTYGKTGKTNLMFVSGSSGNVSFTTSTDITTPENGISMFGIDFTDGVMLTLQDKDVATKGGNVSFLSLAKKDSASPAFGFTTSRDTITNTDTVDLHGVAVGSIKAIGSTNIQNPSAPTDHTYNVVLNKDAIFAGTVALYGENQIINLDMKEASKLFANNSALHIENLKIESTGLDTSDILGNSFTQNNVVIDLATDGNSFENISRNVQQDGYRVLVIGSRSDAGAKPYAVAPTGLTGDNGLFRVYVDTATKGDLGKGVSGMNTAFANANAHSDRIFVNEGSGKHYIQAIYKQGTDLNTISYHDGGVETEGNIAVATVASTASVTFEGASQVQGFDVIGTHLTEGIATDSQGQYNASGAYKTYFIKSATTDGIANSATQTTTSALGINYDLFLANFNSLNKRMGELRDNNNGQGAWARVFVGGLSTSYGLETQSTYTTIQAGYDYAFGFEGANNYLGVALSYANALTDTKKSIDVGGVVSGIDKTSTNGIEVALYNSYVEDSGWFNDTIFKFSYMVSDVKVLNQADTYNTNNFGIVLSDEFGYRFKLGESKEWYIDPQLEVGFGYFNQSDLKQVLGQATLTGIQDAIVTLRARVGANWAYDFKNFTQGKGISASVYLGTYYSYDYISGGEINLVTDLGTKGKLTPLSSTGRFELNVGTNIGVYDNTRIYFDFEKSFGGDITTDYQVNLGVRYSFGESNGYTPAIKTEVAPLKVSEENTSSEEKADTNKTEEKAQ